MRISVTQSALLSVFILLAAAPAIADEYYYAPQLQRVGITSALQAAANNGRGVTIGIVDTGVFANHSELSGRLLSGSTCVATSNCASGFADTYGHGTFVASIAAAAQNNSGMVGAAPGASLLAVKIAQPNGTANLGDMINGITTAATRGANVINLSYSSFYGAPYASYNSYLVTGLNTAASKNAIVVLAGGNSNTTFMGNVNQSGFSAASLSRLIFVGSVNATNGKSSFSNTPGNTVFTATNGQKRWLADMWIMAPGENLIGASPSGPYVYAQGSGTSFSAPLVTGALALLEARWPVLIRNGAATQVLFDTAQDLGAPGVDAVFGHGLMRVDRAFNPIGSLYVTNAAGKGVNVSTITGGIVTSGAFGSLSTLSARLSNMVALDKYQRDFYLNLSSLIQPANRNATLANMTSHVSLKSGGAKFDDGTVLSYGESSNESHTALTPSGTPVPDRNWFLNYTDAAGTTIAGGYGFPASASFATALWDAHSFVGEDMALLDSSTVLLSMAGGGGFAAVGRKLDDKTRVAFSFSQTADQDPLLTTSGNAPDARAFGFGMSREMAKGWTAGLTVGTLDENNGLLGSTYNSNGALGFGDHHNSISIGASSAFDLGSNRSFLVDASWVRSDGATTNGLISDVSAITARSMGAAFVQRDAFKEEDRLSFSLRKPLTVTSGSASLATTSVDRLGYATTGRDNIDLRPDGSETDLGMTYEAPINDQTRWNASFTYRNDANNIKGETDTALMLGIKMAF